MSLKSCVCIQYPASLTLPSCQAEAKAEEVEFLFCYEHLRALEHLLSPLASGQLRETCPSFAWIFARMAKGAGDH